MKENSGFKVWWSLIRPGSLTASIIPVLVGTVLSIADGMFRIWVFLSMLVASILVQAATNIFNDFYDFKRGVDDKQ